MATKKGSRRYQYIAPSRSGKNPMRTAHNYVLLTTHRPFSLFLSSFPSLSLSLRFFLSLLSPFSFSISFHLCLSLVSSVTCLCASVYIIRLSFLLFIPPFVFTRLCAHSVSGQRAYCGVNTHTHARTRTHTYACTLNHTYTRAGGCVCACARARLCVCVACVSACVRACVRVVRTRACTCVCCSCERRAGTNECMFFRRRNEQEAMWSRGHVHTVFGKYTYLHMPPFFRGWILSRMELISSEDVPK